jgi:hypothetical protein
MDFQTLNGILKSNFQGHEKERLHFLRGHPVRNDCTRRQFDETSSALSPRSAPASAWADGSPFAGRFC